MVSAVDAVQGRENIFLYEKPEYGKIVVPSIPHKDRAYGGHLMVIPTAAVHHAHELFEKNPALFYGSQALVMIAETAMLELIAQGLPDGQQGIVNILDGGNWQVHTDRGPPGIKKDGSTKRLHYHLYGRSPLEPTETAMDRYLHWGWGEIYFPLFRDTPFSPPQEKKDWIVPEQFNLEEVAFFRERLIDLATDVNWPK